MHIKTHNHRLPYKLIIAIALALVLLAGGLTAYGIQRQRAAYAADVKGYGKHARQTLTDANQDILTAKHDPQIIKVTLQTAQIKLKKQPEPQVVAILGIPITAKHDTQRLKATNQASRRTQTQMQAAIQLLDYQRTILEALEPLKSVKASNAAEIKTAADQWNNVQANLKTIQPPASAKQFHQSIVDQSGSIAVEIAKLAPLFDKQDVAGFTTQRQVLSVSFDTLRSKHGDLQKILQAQDSKLGAATKELLRTTK